jgi:hypothetical protein
MTRFQMTFLQNMGICRNDNGCNAIFSMPFISMPFTAMPFTAMPFVIMTQILTPFVPNGFYNFTFI